MSDGQDNDLGAPLPEGFYDVEGWIESLTGFYIDQQKKFDRNVLEAPIKRLVTSIGDAISIYGYSSKIMSKSFAQTINPLFDVNEYRDTAYKILKDGAVTENDPRIDKYAESVLCIRNFFERDKEFLISNFSTEIANIPDLEGAERTKEDRFSETMRMITKVHVQQVIDMITEA